MPEELTQQKTGIIFALDIGTRSVIGILGQTVGERFEVLAIEKEEHGRRAMLDGQIEDIEQVARLVNSVRSKLEKSSGIALRRVCIAAAGRALRTEPGSFQLEFSAPRRIDVDTIGRLEAGAVSTAEEILSDDPSHRFYLVGYTVSQYRLDGYPLSTLKGHSGNRIEADVVATFLPSEVVESLYAVVNQIGLEIASLTLEPIASLNAAIPAELRLLNLVLADIGAGTSDIAVCRDGSVVGYTMATLAGDEITELLMRELLVDFKTAEQLKLHMADEAPVSYSDILGLSHEVPPAELRRLAEPSAKLLAKEIAARVLLVNGGPPSALFLAGGGSKLAGLPQLLAEQLEMDVKRVALAGNNFDKSAFSDEYDLNDPEYATPLGIAISAGLGLISDSYLITLNNQPAKLFRNGTLVLRDILLMNGYTYADLIGHSGESLSVTLDGRRHFFRGTPSTTPELRLNDEEATLSTVVHAGDSISFVPALCGQAATKTLGELLGEDFTGLIYVNAQPQGLDYRLVSGDSILTQRKSDIAPLLPTIPLPTPVPEEPDLEPVTVAAPAPAETAPPLPEETLPAPRPPFPLRLNGRALTLRDKTAIQPYYLMDLLEYSGLDFDHLDSPVVLLINGQPGLFTQQLHEEDNVIIQCQSALS